MALELAFEGWPSFYKVINSQGTEIWICIFMFFWVANCEPNVGVGWNEMWKVGWGQLAKTWWEFYILPTRDREVLMAFTQGGIWPSKWLRNKTKTQEDSRQEAVEQHGWETERTVRPAAVGMFKGIQIHSTINTSSPSRPGEKEEDQRDHQVSWWGALRTVMTLIETGDKRDSR